MVNNILANGRIIKCTENKVNLNGQMEEFIQAIMYKIKNMGMEFIHTLMVDPTKVNGHMVSSTEKVYLLHLKEHRRKEFGMKEKELDGLMKMKPIPKSEYYYN